MFENPNEEVYFGEVYRQILQESWAPSGAGEWDRLGLSRRGHRPTQRGITSPNLTPSQEQIRRWFSSCAAAWRDLPWATPADQSCDNRWGRDYWWKRKSEYGVSCSYYDLYMRYCLSFALETGCIPPANYLLSVKPPLTDIACNKVYDLTFPNACGDISMVSGDGQFIPPGEWTSPQCGTEGELCFKDTNGSFGSIPFHFSLEYWCEPFIWPSYNPLTIAPDITKPVYVQGGVAPYYWSVSGAGFSLAEPTTLDPVNSIYASSSSCGSCKISVSDTCGNTCFGYVLSTVGVWSLKSNSCVLSGTGTQIGEAPPDRIFFELVSGNKKQLQTRYWVGGCGSDPNCGSPPCVEYCEGQIAAACADPSLTNCIDPINVYPYYCFDPPGTSWGCYCVSGLEYYEWECP